MVLTPSEPVLSLLELGSRKKKVVDCHSCGDGASGGWGDSRRSHWILDGWVVCVCVTELHCGSECTVT